MNHYYRGQTFNQKVETLKSLLKVFGRLDPPAAAMAVQDFTEKLVAEVREVHIASGMTEVGR